ncbi:undecaprenyl-diphosphate phosphatase [Mangrovibacillus cuniculi]|uniref:Undecaprenyl-diphosphatase n=1 Tax=Mangrovibacillus cuniculi TaxID=2593652 RepID=A0A7S8CDU2_9BACI|nr:undecaprenyl-diphosphate phosphatase [Mangrovibacillus cuniculi]QPC48135.1 undecaprenyl-diphosphate phosphatase [Mangrovibacillus cuniculi]
MNIWELIVALILGVVEGLTEFAPVSSTGHMIIVDDMLLQSKELLGSQDVANTFKVVIQLGSILAVVIVFWSRFMDLLGIKKQDQSGSSRLTLSTVLVGLLPAIVLGFAFEDFIDTYLFSVETVIVGLVAGAVLMIAADWKVKRDEKAGIGTKIDGLDAISYKNAFLIGLFQCIALWPGFSRSGSTISGGVLLGLPYRAAADFTFIMAVPIMAGASGLSVLKNLEYFTADMIPFFAVGFVSAFIFAFISIRFFLALISKIRLLPFAIYRIVLAFVILGVYLNMN